MSRTLPPPDQAGDKADNNPAPWPFLLCHMASQLTMRDPCDPEWPSHLQHVAQRGVVRIQLWPVGQALQGQGQRQRQRGGCKKKSEEDIYGHWETSLWNKQCQPGG